jgi:PAS domain S-box-containing protein
MNPKCRVSSEVVTVWLVPLAWIAIAVLTGLLTGSAGLGCGIALAGLLAGHVTPAQDESSAPTTPPSGTGDTQAGAGQFSQSPQDLFESGNLLETLLENCPDFIYFKDRQSRFVCYSLSFREFLKQFNCEDVNWLKGKTDFDLFAPEHAQRAFDDEQEIIRTGQPVIGKLEREVHAKGRVTWALTTKLPWRDKRGNIIGTFGLSKNVTAIKEAEQQLAHERELFRALVENLPDAIYFKDRESRFVKLSRFKVERARQLLLKRHHETHPPGDTDQLAPHLTDTARCGEYLIGKSDFDLCSPENARAALDEEQAILRTGTPLVGKVDRMTEEDGTPYWWLTTKMPWRNEKGEIVGTFGVTRDITPMKEAEAKLEEINKRFAHTSRMAGMAEVASDVLHNVGNVLNSVNVSCSLVIDRVRESNFDNLAKVPALIRSQAGQLETFFGPDPRGAQVLGYLEAVAGDFTEQREFLLKELSQLRNHIDHIKRIVAMQQNYAKVSGISELITPEQLVEDAVQINAGALTRHQVELQREFSPTPPLLVDKHKVLQILVNLISNAKYAIGAVRRTDKQITLRVATDGPDEVLIQVTDNGMGIARENLTRIFAHGFTTRHDGHGFGLHSGALAAKELGGALTAHSDGPGCGATFALRLPLRPPTHQDT